MDNQIFKSYLSIDESIYLLKGIDAVTDRISNVLLEVEAQVMFEGICMNLDCKVMVNNGTPTLLAAKLYPNKGEQYWKENMIDIYHDIHNQSHLKNILNSDKKKYSLFADKIFGKLGVKSFKKRVCFSKGVVTYVKPKN